MNLKVGCVLRQKYWDMEVAKGRDKLPGWSRHPWTATKIFLTSDLILAEKEKALSFVREGFEKKISDFSDTLKTHPPISEKNKKKIIFKQF